MIDLGDVVPLSVTITDPTGTLANATAVTVTVTLPDLTVDGPHPVTPTSTGVYDYNFATTQAGRHTVRWVATGTNASAYRDEFDVAGATSPALISLDQAKTQLNITSTTNDEALRGYILSATDIVNSCCGYTTPTTITETVSGLADASGRGMLALSRGPVLSVSSVVAQLQGMPATDLTSLVINVTAGTVYMSNSYPFFGPVTVTYVAGRSGEVPQVLQDACALLVKWLWETRRGGSTAIPAQGGDELTTFMGIVMPSRVAALLSMSPYTAAPGIA